MDAAPRTALIVGVTGMVGQPLSQSLLARRWRVYGAARFTDDLKRQQVQQSGVEAIKFDILTDNAADLPDVDVLFLEVWDRSHFTNFDDRQAIWALNYDAVGRLGQRYAGSTAIINGSTASIYGCRGDRPSLEDDFPRPEDEYALVRLAQEKLLDFFCDQAASPIVHLRYCFSNSETKGFIRRLADTIAAEQSLGDQPDRQVQVIGVSDFVRCTALAGATDAPLPRAINVVHPHVWTLRQLAERIYEHLGRGRVVFDCDTGGMEGSIWADPQRMIECFGPPEEELDALIERVARAAGRGT